MGYAILIKQVSAHDLAWDMPIDVEKLEKAIDMAEESVIEMVRQGKLDFAMKMVLGVLREALVPLVESVNKLATGLAELRERSRELFDSVVELKESTANLERSLRMESAQRRYEVMGLRGEMAHMSFRFTLERICAEYGLSFEPLPPDPYRVDGVVEGERIVALVEIAKMGSERDVEQLLEGARIYEREEGRRPDALVLYVYARKPPAELIELCGEHGIIVDSSPRRVARRLAELDRGLGERA